MKKMTLTEARKAGKLEEFIAAREVEAASVGDRAALNRTLASMARTSKVVPATSKKACPDD